MLTAAEPLGDLVGRAEALDQRRRFAAVRDRLAVSPLVRNGGVLVGQVADAATVDELRADALVAHAAAVESKVPLSSQSDQRGDPDRWLESAPGGPRQDAFARSPRVLEALARATGVACEPAGPGSWSYYRRAGHHLGVHRDLAVCDLAVITCVLNTGSSGESGALRIWSGRLRDELEAVRSDPRGGTDILLAVGDTVLLLGGIVPHRVLPMDEGHLRIVAPLCYRLGG